MSDSRTPADPHQLGAAGGCAVAEVVLPAAVLWDMDGTLVDTEPYWIAEERRLVESHGGRWTDEDAHALVGNPLEVSAHYIRDHSPVTAGVDDIVHTLMSGVIERVRGHVPWRPGAAQLLAALRAAGVPCALVTMSWEPLAACVLEAAPAGSFQAVVTGDMVRRGKPDPEPYARACELLGVAPLECIAIEDSGTGARSAAAAGVRTLVVPHVVEVPQLPGTVQIPSLVGVTPAELVGLARPAAGPE